MIKNKLFFILLYFLNIKYNFYIFNKSIYFKKELNLYNYLINYKNFLLFSDIYINNISEHYFKNKNYDKAIYYYSLIVKLSTNNENICNSLIKIGDIFLIKKEYKKAKFIYEQAYVINYNNCISKKLLKIINKLEKIIK